MQIIIRSRSSGNPADNGHGHPDTHFSLTSKVTEYLKACYTIHAASLQRGQREKHLQAARPLSALRMAAVMTNAMYSQATESIQAWKHQNIVGFEAEAARRVYIRVVGPSDGGQ